MNSSSRRSRLPNLLLYPNLTALEPTFGLSLSKAAQPPAPTAQPTGPPGVQLFGTIGQVEPETVVTAAHTEGSRAGEPKRPGCPRRWSRQVITLRVVRLRKRKVVYVLGSLPQVLGYVGGPLALSRLGRRHGWPPGRPGPANRLAL